MWHNDAHWVPDRDKPADDMLYERVLRLCGNRRTAIDGGANVGLWTRRMAADFDAVHAFEPAADTFECLVNNIDKLPNVTLHQEALGDRYGHCGLAQSPNGRSISDYIIPKGRSVKMVRLDELKLEDVDFIKLDLEGSEPIALGGARVTIRKWHPVVLIEEKPQFMSGRVNPFFGEATRTLVMFGMKIAWTDRINVALVWS